LAERLFIAVFVRKSRLYLEMKKISVIIPTHNRQEQVIKTVENLRQQNFPPGEYEIIVVDDGSSPPISLPTEFSSAPPVRIIRLEGVERSIARNTGAGKASGELLVFLDDDIFIEKDSLNNFWQAHIDFPDALFVGEILLPPEALETPFGRFRQNLEQSGIPVKRGEVAQRTFCAAGNMAIKKSVFDQLEGFDIILTSSEDQDFALRHTARGEKIVFVPEAAGIHYDNALTIQAYCRRNEWGSRLMQPFYQRYPQLPANVEREKINGNIAFGKETLKSSLRKAFKSVIASPPIVKLLFLAASFLENTAPQSKILNRVYALLLGAHIFRGYRAAVNN
jgi:GT2 family glycosyltransferase